MIRALLAALLLAACAAAPVPKQEAMPYPEVQAALESLQTRAAPQSPYIQSVTVVIQDLSAQKLWGYTDDLGGGHWLIALHAGMCPPLMVDVLIHEWAHLLAGYAGTCDEDSHGPIFGVCWATAYRAYHQGN